MKKKDGDLCGLTVQSILLYLMLLRLLNQLYQQSTGIILCAIRCRASKAEL